MPPFPMGPELLNTKREKIKTKKDNKVPHKSSENKSYFNTQKAEVPNIFNNLVPNKERISESVISNPLHRRHTSESNPHPTKIVGMAARRD